MALEIKPDIILLDLLMPRVDGVKVLETLRTDEWGKSVPIIVFTNLPIDQKLETQLLTYEPIYFFSKSDTSLEEMVNKVREFLL